MNSSSLKLKVCFDEVCMIRFRRQAIDRLKENRCKSHMERKFASETLEKLSEFNSENPQIQVEHEQNI